MAIPNGTQHPPIRLAAPVGPPVAETVVEHSAEALGAAPDDVFAAAALPLRVPETADPLVVPPADGELCVPPVTKLPDVCTEGGCEPLT
jgi:hypothetical protein